MGYDWRQKTSVSNFSRRDHAEVSDRRVRIGNIFPFQL